MHSGLALEGGLNGSAHKLGHRHAGTILLRFEPRNHAGWQENIDAGHGLARVVAGGVGLTHSCSIQFPVASLRTRYL